jgi:NADH:ubiquinone oxidoreductase subunit 5 (subunit L)/multisubunit Na+/H+ antiporter MnhA subunit
MIPLVDDKLALVFGAPLVAAVLLFALARTPLLWGRIAIAFGAHGVALVVSVLLGVRVLERGGFAYADVQGWVGARIEAVDPFGLVPSSLGPGQVPLLIAVEIAGLLGTLLLLPMARQLRTSGPLAAALAATGAVALLVVARRADGICAAFTIASVAGFALLVSFHPRRTEVEGAVRAFLLHRVGDVLLLTALFLVAPSVGAGDLHKLAETAPAIEPWGRAVSGTFAGFAAREAWQLIAMLGALAVATRIAFVPLLPLVRDASGAPGPAVGIAHGLCFIGAGAILLYRLTPVLWLAPEVMSALGWVAALSIGFAALFAVAAHDVVRIDVNLLCAFGALVALCFAAADLAVGVLASTLLILASIPLCATSGVVLERTGRADPFALGGLEHKLPRTHTARLLATGALFGPVFSGAFLAAHALKACLFSPWLGPAVAILVGVTLPVLAIAAFRPLHLIFTGKAPRDALANEATEPGASRTLPPLIVALPLLGLGLLFIPPGVLSALPFETTYEPPFATLFLPERVVLQGIRGHVLLPWVAPSVGPGVVALVALGALTLGWIAASALYRSGPSSLHRALFSGARVQRLVDITAQVAGRESQVARGVGEGAARLSRLIATNLAPGVLDTLLRRIPSLVGIIMGAVVRFVANGSTQRGIAIALLVLAVLALWWGRG